MDKQIYYARQRPGAADLNADITNTENYGQEVTKNLIINQDTIVSGFTGSAPGDDTVVITASPSLPSLAYHLNGKKVYVTTGGTRQTFAFLDSPVFVGSPQMPSGTTFIGLATCSIRPLVDSTQAIHIHKADGITPLVNFDTISGLTGFGTVVPKAQIHLYGTDTTENTIGIQKNGLILDGIVGTDKVVAWNENGVPHWEANISL